jgi:D-glycero-D-manno-heptose 1,7-bisphosphate phosphatase
VSPRPAVFLDRDGTVIPDTGFVRDTEGVSLLPGAAAAVARLNAAGFPVIVVTNQSGIARGLLTEAAYAAVAARVEQLLGAEGARLTATYHCPHHPDVTGPCACRKPGVLLYHRAAEEHDVDLTRSWWIGDRMRDVVPARAFGGRGILLGTGGDTMEEATAAGFQIALDLAAAVELILPD